MKSTVEQSSITQMDAHITTKGMQLNGMKRATIYEKTGRSWNFKQRLSNKTRDAFARYLVDEVEHDYPGYVDREADIAAVTSWLNLMHKSEGRAIVDAIIKSSDSIIANTTATTLIQALARTAALTQRASYLNDLNAAQEVVTISNAVIEEIGGDFDKLDMSVALGPREALLNEPEASPAGVSLSALLAYMDIAAHILNERPANLALIESDGLLPMMAVRAQVLKSPIPMINLAEILFLNGDELNSNKALDRALSYEPKLMDLISTEWHTILEKAFVDAAIKHLTK